MTSTLVQRTVTLDIETTQIRKSTQDLKINTAMVSVLL